MQFIFYWTLLGLAYAAKLFIRAIVFIPLLFAGYVLATHILSKKDNGIWWVAVTLVIAYSFYLLIFFFKGIILALKRMKSWGWIPLFILCVAFTCLLPVWMVHSFLDGLIANKAVVWILSLAFAFYVYMKYEFTLDKAPRAAVPFYHAGIDLAIALFRRPGPVC